MQVHRKTLLFTIAMILVLFMTSPAKPEQQSMSIPADQPLPVLNVYCDVQLVPVVEDFAIKMRQQNIIDLHLSSDTSDNLLIYLQDKPELADIILTEGKDSILLGNKLGILSANDVISIASDRLVAVAAKGRDISSPVSYISKVKKGRIVIADPNKNIVGLHADQALKRIGLGKAVDGKLRHTKNDQLAAIEVEKGNADIAIVYQSTMFQNTAVYSIMTMPKNSYLPIIYFGSPLSHLVGAKKNVAKAILSKLAGPESKDIWMKYGFSPPPKNTP